MTTHTLTPADQLDQALKTFNDAAFACGSWEADDPDDTYENLLARLKTAELELRKLIKVVPPSAWILTIDVGGPSSGAQTSLHATEAGAQAALVAYVRQNWNAEVQEEDCPEEIDDDAIDRYFDASRDYSYSIREDEVTA